MNTAVQTYGTKLAPTHDFLSFVTVIIPAYNEENYIARALAGALDQDYPSDRMEIIVADGGSTDSTREIVSAIAGKHSNVRLISNPQRIVPTGLNKAIESAHGDIVVRFDGHCEYPRNYVRSVVMLRQESGADSAGGVLVPIGTTYVQQSVACAYYSRVGFGGYALKATNSTGTIRDVDTVHGGCWKRQRLIEVGGFDETMVRNQDDELSFRLRKGGGRIIQTLNLQVRYHVRNSFRKLFLQFAQYGYWKTEVIRKHPKQASIRHIVPALFVTTLCACIVLAPLSTMAFELFAALMATYLTILTIATVMQTWSQNWKLWPGVVWALVLMHIAYGIGFLAGSTRVIWGSHQNRRLFSRVTR